MKKILALLERNKIPDPLLRFGIRRMNAQRLFQEGRGSPEQWQQRKMDWVRRLRESPLAIQTQAANEQHYELPTRFFELVLGQRLKYSSGLWRKPSDNLDIAEEAMLELYCNRAQIRDGQRILELGSGWGSLCFYIAEKFPRCSITTLTNSRSQKEWLDQRIRSKGYSIRVIKSDINDFQLEEKFDRVVSIEMFEHLRNYEMLFRKIAHWLEESGLLFVHIFTHRDFAYPYEVKDDSDWMAKYFFSGGMMPSQDLFHYFQSDLRIVDQWQVDGSHYQKTAEAWLQNMDASRKEIFELFKQVYPKDELTKWWVYWRVFFLACAEMWGHERGREWGLSHYLFARR